MLVELAAWKAYKSWKKRRESLLESLEDHGDVVHVSRPANGQKLKQPIRIIKTNGV